MTKLNLNAAPTPIANAEVQRMNKTLEQLHEEMLRLREEWWRHAKTEVDRAVLEEKMDELKKPIAEAQTRRDKENALKWAVWLLFALAIVVIFTVNGAWGKIGEFLSGLLALLFIPHLVTGIAIAFGLWALISYIFNTVERRNHQIEEQTRALQELAAELKKREIK